MNRRNFLRTVLVGTGIASVPAIATATPQQSSEGNGITLPELRLVSKEILERYPKHHIVWDSSNENTVAHITNNGYYVVRMRFDYDTKLFIRVSDILRGFNGPIPAHIQAQLS